MIMIANPNYCLYQWQDFCPDSTPTRLRGLQLFAQKNVVTSKMLCFIERSVGSLQRAFDIFIFKNGNTDADGDIGGDAFVEEMRDFQIVDMIFL